MKQVQLKIEEFFNKEFVIDDFHNNDGSYKLANKVFRLIELLALEPAQVTYGLYHKFKSSTTREKLIKTLWKFQKSLLPCDKKMDEYLTDELTEIGHCNYSSNGYTYYTDAVFYDPKTRIITITKFQKEIEEL